jgi:hypothetical protein
MFRTCRICNEEKLLEEFYKTGSNTRSHKCKDCTCKEVRANRIAKIKYYREYDKLRASVPHRVSARKEYALTKQGIAASNAAKKKWAEHNRAKKRLHIIVNNAIRAGKIIKHTTCQACGKTNCRIEGHHNDYTKPFDVRWLCSACHREWHKINGTVEYEEAA